MSYEVWDDRNGGWLVFERRPRRPAAAAAACPTREAAEAARRLLSGECERELAEAQMDRLVAAKTGPGKPMRDQRTTRECERRYNEGRDDGAAQERARIVALLKRADWAVAAGIIERGEGE